MTTMDAKGPIKNVEIGIKVIRKSGMVQDYGTVASNSRWFRLVGHHIAARRTRKLNKQAGV